MRPILLLIFAACPTLASAASLSVQVTDSGGTPVEDAVVFAEPVGGGTLPKPPKNVEVSQISRRFEPLVTVVQTGTEISFPNKDKVKHHVYSFSKPKVFDIPLYSGTSSTPQTFTKSGTVVLGCNIHDNMVGYIQVVDTPYFAKTDKNGNTKIEGISAGNYTLKVWHYKLPPLEQVLAKPVKISEHENETLFKLNLTK